MDQAVIVRRSEPALVVGLNWIAERTLGRLGRHRRLCQDHEFRGQTSGTLIEIVATRTMPNRLAPV